MHADVVIIGAGVTGCSIARELSKYSLNLVLVEKECDVCFSTSKANNGIVHAGYDPKPGSLKAKLNARGNYLYEQTSKELEVPFKRIGSLVVATKEEAENEDAEKKLEELKKQGDASGIQGMQIVRKEWLKENEPNLASEAELALYAPSTAIICPYSYTIALAENAAANGVKIMLETTVTGIKTENGKVKAVETSKGTIETSIVVNAAGVYCDDVARMANAGDFQIIPRKGEYFLLDKGLNLINHVLFPLPSKMGKGITLTPTVEGNVLLGPTAEDVQDREDASTTKEGLEKALNGARKLIPKASKANVIRTFAGLRAVASTGDFIIGETNVDGFINAAGIQSPGLAANPAIAEMVAEIIVKKLEAKKNEKFKPGRKAIPRISQMKIEDANELIKQNPAYGRIVCRCEKVTEGEIIEAIARCRALCEQSFETSNDSIKRGACTIDGVKFRVRTGMGKCQGGFCSQKVIELISQEAGIPLTQVTKKGRNSHVILGRTKEE